jgi:hypothetical protein
MAWIQIKSERQRKWVEDIKPWKLPLYFGLSIFSGFELYEAVSTGRVLIFFKSGPGDYAPFDTQPFNFTLGVILYLVFFFVGWYWLFLGIAKARGKIEYSENSSSIPRQD